MTDSRDKRFALLDRDGTLIEERHYLADPDRVKLIAGAGKALARLRQAGWGIVLVTNQSGVARGYFTMEAVDAVHARLRDLLAAESASLDGIYSCPHGPDDRCDCRKPLPGMALQAARELGFDPRHAVVVGDKALDIAFGQAIGAQTIRVLTGYGANPSEAYPEPDRVAADLSAAVDLMLAETAAADR